MNACFKSGHGKGQTEREYESSVERELLQLRFQVTQVLETLQDASLSANIRKLRLFIEKTTLELVDIPRELFEPWNVIDRLLVICKKLDPTRFKFVIEETIQLCSKIFARWNMPDSGCIFRRDRLPPEYLHFLFWKDNISDDISIAIARLLATVYNGTDEIAHHVFAVIPIDAVASFVDRSEKVHLFPMLANFLRVISRYDIPEDQRENFVLLSAKFVKATSHEAIAYALEAISHTFSGNSNNLVSCLEGINFVEDLERCLNIDPCLNRLFVPLIRKNCFEIMGKIAMSGFETPMCNYRPPLQCLLDQNDNADVQVTALFALYNIVMNLPPSDREVFEIVQVLLRLSEMSPFQVRAELLKDIPAICISRLPPESYHDLLLSSNLFHYLRDFCSTDVVQTTPDALDRILSLIDRVFRQAQSEGWNAECVELFIESQGPSILENIRETGRSDLIELAESFYRTNIETDNLLIPKENSGPAAE